MTKILFIEGEPAMHKILGEFLRQKGFEVLSALDGERGLALAKKEHPDLMLLDLVLSKTGGLEVLDQVRQDHNLASAPVIVLTNVESDKDAEKALALGAKACLVKVNCNLDEVLGKIKTTLGE